MDRGVKSSDIHRCLLQFTDRKHAHPALCSTVYGASSVARNCKEIFYNKSQRDALSLTFIFDIAFYIFRIDLVSVIRSLNNVYTKIGIFHDSYGDCCR